MPRAAQTAPTPPRPPRKRGAAAANTAKTGLAARSRGIDTSTYAGAEQIDPNKPLTDKQKAFVKLWAAGESIISASERAGYSDGGTYAYRLIRYPNVLSLYQEEKRKYEEAAGMSRKKVMDMLLESYEAAKMTNEPASMVSAAREIGKMCGYYEPTKHTVAVSVQGKVVVERLNRMSDADLLRAITDGNALDLVETTDEEG